MADVETPVVAPSDATAPVIPAEESRTAETLTGGEGEPQADSHDGDTDTEEKPKRLGGWQRKQLKAEQERDFWREEALRARTQQAEPAKPATAAPAEKAKPTPADFAVGDGTYDVAAYT